MKHVIFFLSIFLSTFLLLMFYDKWVSSPPKKNILNEVMASKVMETQINGVKVLSRNGSKNMALPEFLSEIKNGIKSSDGKIVHENSNNDRHYITYISENKQHSFILQATSVKSCRYMHFTTTDSGIPQYEKNAGTAHGILMPPNAELVLNMNDGKGKSLISFLTDLSVSEVESFYLSSLIESGWRKEDVEIPNDFDLPDSAGTTKSLYFMKEKLPLVINIMNDPSSDSLMVFIIKG